VRSILAGLWIVAEPLRLYIGYYANLGETIPWLVIFCVLTCAPQTPVCYYLMVAQQDRRPVDTAVQLTQAILLHLQLVAALATIWRVFQRRRERYFLVEHALKQGTAALMASQSAARAGGPAALKQQ
jgi:hypothetical protein